MPRPLPPILTLAQIAANPPPPHVPLIEGLLNRGNKLILFGSSKSNKSWIMMHMAYCISQGMPWWGLPVHRGKVLYLNFELDERGAWERMSQIAAIMGQNVALDESFSLWNLKGAARHYSELCAQIKERLGKDHTYNLLTVDPFYMFNSSDKSENDATDMTLVMNAMDNLMMELKVAIALAHHSPKGDMEERDVLDRGSGSGVLARNPDAIVDVRQIKGTFDQFKAEFRLRYFPPREPLGLRFTYPLMQPDPTVEVMPKETNADALLKILPASGYTSKDWQQAALERLDMSRATFHRQKSDLHMNDKIEVVDGVWVPMTPGKVIAQ